MSRILGFDKRHLRMNLQGQDLQAPRPQRTTVARASIDDDIIEYAIRMIQTNQWSIRVGAAHCGISPGSMFNAVKGKHKGQHGGQTVFTAEEEMKIVRYIKFMERWKLPLTRRKLRDDIRQFLVLAKDPRIAKFKKDGRPGKWEKNLLFFGVWNIK